MRAAVTAALLVVPLLAGCTDEGEGIRLESFTATYDVPAQGDVPPFVATVRFGDVVPYIAADGQTHEGYLVDVDYGAATRWLSRGQAILDAGLALQRIRWCNGWNEGGYCIDDQYDWVSPNWAWPKATPFGIGMTEAPPRGAMLEGPDVVRVDGQTFEYDGKLAPFRLDWAGAVATRSSYEGAGRLPDLGAASVAALPAPHMEGPGLAHADRPLPGVPYSLDDAFEHLLQDNATAREMLDQGGCVRFFTFAVARFTPAAPLPVLLADEVQSTITIELANGERDVSFDVPYGRRMPLGEEGFLATSGRTPTTRAPFDCGARTTMASLSGQLALADLLMDGPPVFLYGGWSAFDTFYLTVTGDGMLSIDGSAGQLWSWNVGLGISIDPPGPP